MVDSVAVAAVVVGAGAAGISTDDTLRSFPRFSCRLAPIGALAQTCSWVQGRNEAAGLRHSAQDVALPRQGVSLSGDRAHTSRRTPASPASGSAPAALPFRFVHGHPRGLPPRAGTGSE